MSFTQEQIDPYGCPQDERGAILLRCSKLVVGYDGQPLLPPIDFSLHHGELCAVIGRNGAGKTTWFRTLLGLISPVSGTIERCVDPLPLGYIAQRVELTPILPLRAADVVAMGLERGLSFLRPFGGKARRTHVHETLEQVDALDLADRPFGQLSEGQKQRVLIARLLVGHPHIAVLDEPTAAMDRVAEQETLDLVGRLCAQHHMAVLIVSHQLREVTHIADQVIFLDRASQTVIRGSAAEVLAHDSFRAYHGLLHPEDR